MASSSNYDIGVLRGELTDLHALLEHLLFRLQEAARPFQADLQANRTQDRRAERVHWDGMESQASGADQGSAARLASATQRCSVHQLMLELHCLNTQLGEFLIELEQHLQIGEYSTSEQEKDNPED